MARSHQKSSIRRQNKNTRYVGKFILFVEGMNTEYTYFELLKKSNCQIKPVVKKGKGISSCVDFVNEAINKFEHLPQNERNTYKQKWLVFDFDGRPDFADGIKIARDKGFKVAFSSMCIEYWFVLHFRSHDGAPIPMKGNSHSKAQVDMINSYILSYNKGAAHKIQQYNSSSKKVDDDFFDLLMATDPESGRCRALNAFLRARKIHQKKKSNGDEFSESVTTIYELLADLGMFEKQSGTWKLFTIDDLQTH